MQSGLHAGACTRSGNPSLLLSVVGGIAGLSLGLYA